MADQSSTSHGSVGFRIHPCGEGATKLYGSALTSAGVCDGYNHHLGRLQALYNVKPTKRWLLPEKSLTGRRLFCVSQSRAPVPSIEEADGVRSWLVSRPEPETQGQDEVLGPYKTVLERTAGVPTLSLTDLRGGRSAVYALESDPTRVDVRNDPRNQELGLIGSFWKLGSSLIARPDPSDLASTSADAKLAANVSSGPTIGSASQVRHSETPKTAVLRVAHTKQAQRDSSGQWLSRNLDCETKSPSRTDLSCCLPSDGLTFDRQVNLDYAKGLMSKNGSEVFFAVSNGKTSYATSTGPTDMTGTLLILYPPTGQGDTRAAAGTRRSDRRAETLDQTHSCRQDH